MAHADIVEKIERMLLKLRYKQRSTMWSSIRPKLLAMGESTKTNISG